MKVKEVADLVGISVRTLHHYDEIGLLRPETTEAGYRMYSERDLETLQQILFFKELGFSLKEIQKILEDPAFDRKEALELQRKMLVEKRSHVDHMITTIDKTIKQMLGEIEMTNKEKFEGMNFDHNPYEEEARRRWGDEKVDESNNKIKGMSKEDKKKLSEEWDGIYTRLAKLRHGSPDSAEAQEAIHEWYEFLNHFGQYSYEAFRGLGQMYVDDERFTKNIDNYGEGLAIFMRDAMAVYAD
ncbi:MerR family transcriptional regulator [Guptibacillus algicola]|uniref:MerR family transcriptional regulator n=1 Tax=Guptibacillus algicola TaxID=225844 RepID=UPI001CD1BDA3|nr:MerR family transcriptional regulator [Alkalihalobacillus algicola]MCA0987164.1 MerR family transcriptional regulator [Alkalihalobacillus algicola]